MDFLKTTFADFEELFEEGDLKEIPVDLDTFLNDPYYLGKAKIKQISEVQRKIIESISQIYKLPTLIEIHGEEEGTRIWEEDTYHEIVAMCGKGGGKDFSSRLGFIYTIYKLHCLRDPITYYDKAHGTYIDLLNIAINADQANNVFFSPLKNIISMSPYFQEKGFEPRKSTLEFYECPIRLHSGNSEAEAWEGLDLMLVVLDEIAAFKCLGENVPVLTPNGWVKNGELKVGDYVIGRDGKPTEILHVFEAGNKEVFEVEFEDGAVVQCSDDHIWHVREYSDGRRPSYKDLELKDFKSLTLKGKYNQKRYAIPVVEPVEFAPSDPLPIDPYVMGILIGDGSIAGGSVRFTSDDDFVVREVSKRLPECQVRHSSKCDYLITGGGIIDKLRDLGLWGHRANDKFIPAPYLYASVEDRKLLLAGLMDSDGTPARGHGSYTTVSTRLKDDFIELCRGLGGVPMASEHNAWYKGSDEDRVECQNKWMIRPRVPFNPFLLPRKAKKWKPHKRTLWRTIVDVRSLGYAEKMKCIKVANEDGLYVINDYVVTHNTDSNLKNNAGGAQRLSASSIYDMSKNSVVSRFGDIGKVVLLSFPRFSGDFICQRYDESASEGGVLRIKAPTWVMNPFVTRESLEPQFKRSPVQAEMRFGCIAEGERIWTSRGLVPIEDVRDFDLVNTRFGPRRAKIWSTGEKNCLKITLNNGLHLTCSHDHGLLKINGIRRGKNKWGERRAEVDGPYVSEWVRADELKVGDRLELKSETGVFGNNGLSYDEGYLLGLILSDGWIRNDSRKYVGISCGSNRNFAERISDTFKQTFGDCRIVEKTNKNYPNNVCYDVTSTQSAVVEKIIGLGIKPVKAHEKRVPEVIWSAPEDGIKGFLTGFIDGDGSIEKGKIVSVHSTSRLLLDDLQLLLAGFGGRSSIYLNKEAGSVARAEVGEIKSNHNLYSLRVGTAGSSRIAEWLNLRSHKGNDTGFNSGERIREDARIVSIEEVGEKATWDISVPGVNEFVCQGIVVHNCNPPEMIDAFFRDPAAVRQCFRGEWEVIDAGTPEEKRVLREIPELFPLNPDGTFKDWFEAKDDYPRFIHVDLGLKRDRAALCMVHSPGTRKVEIEYEVYENLPVIKMDLIHYWEAKEGQEIDFSQVREMIKLLARKFPVAKVTFDRWNSNDMVQMLNRRGIYATHHSVKKNDYDTLSTAFYDGRFSGYFVEELVEKELLKLQILNNGKVDHPEGFHDDLAQALASAVWNCCEHADLDTEIELDILGTADDWEALEYAEAVDEERRRKDRRFGKQKSSMTYDESEDDFNWHTI